MEVASLVVRIEEQTDVAEARRRAGQRAAQAGFDEIAAGRVAIIVTEAATNLLKHAGGGDLLVGPASNRGVPGLQVMAVDKGRGMPNVSASLRDGYSTSGTAGNGLGAIARAATTFDLYSQPGRGTVLAATVFPRASEPLSAAAVSVAMPGEDVCGDGWAIWSAGQLTSVFLCDGLGHGPQAAAATALGIEAFRRHGERSAAEVVGYVHDALRSTRGATVAVAELDQRENTVRYCGLGNISATVLTPSGDTRHLVSHSGIAGHNLRRLQSFTYEWPRGSILVMHSDGIATHWSLASYERLIEHRVDVIAGVILRDHRRGRDDATVAVVRNGTPQ
jgi:anti-sigma regulatory factor (Ser/Thr protein kinase)